MTRLTVHLAGETPKDPKHVFANPLNPAVCPILALALYLLCVSRAKDQVALFQGGTQENRFGTMLRSALQTEEGREICRAEGIRPEDIATHSLRKGAATWVLSFAEANPSALFLRAGWTLGSTKDRYVHYSITGDQTIGRLVSGLPIHQSNFAILPPHFESHNSTVSETIQRCYPHLVCQTNMGSILRFCLASVIYHLDFLKEKLPSRDYFFQSALFCQETPLSALKDMIKCGITSSVLQATGIPSTVILQRDISSIHDRFDELPHQIGEVMDERGATAGNLTVSALASHLAPIREMLATVVNTPPRVSPSEEHVPYHRWENDKWTQHLLPMDFALPDVSVQQGFHLWLRGTDSICAYRQLRPSHIYRNDTRKRFSDWKFVYSRLEQHLEAKFSHVLHQANIAEEEIAEMWNDAYKYIINIANILFPVSTVVSPQGRKRKSLRPAEWRVQTTSKRIRLYERLGEK